MNAIPIAEEGAKEETAIWDVFVSHSHTDETRAAAIAAALSEAGLRVFRAIGAIDPFTSISDSVLRALRNSRLLLACYSADYPTRSACQYEFAAAYLAGQAEGDPLRRVVAINFERTPDHIEPRHLRDSLLPSIGSAPSPASLAEVATAVASRIASTPRIIGEVPDRPARWIDGAAIHPPNHFVGRWRELWWLHSALHPNVGPLTSQPTIPVAVIHGPVGIGKTALAAQYVRRFGAAFPGGIVWRSGRSAASLPDAGSASLWVFDDVEGAEDQIAARMPSDLGTPCLVLTRDSALTRLGNALTIDDLSSDESAQLITSHRVADPVRAQQITAATAGSPELRGRVAELTAGQGFDLAIAALHRSNSPLLAPLADRLRQALSAVTETESDVLRVLAAVTPAAISILHIADIVGSLLGTDRLREFAAVQRAVASLVSRGIVRSHPGAVELHLANGIALALREIDPDPYRADLVRAQTVQTVMSARSAEPSLPHQRATTGNPEQVQAAHLIRTELLHRVTGNPLPDNAGSLREALSSLYHLLKTVRTVYSTLSPRSLHTTPSGVDLGDIVRYLIEDVLRDKLTRWHNDLGAHEDIRPAGVSRIEHERQWPHNEGLREDLLAIHRASTVIAEQLALVIEDS
jgi:hypothetical protein